MANRIRIEDGIQGPPPAVEPGMYYQNASGIWLPVTGTPVIGYAPLVQADGSVAWNDPGSGGGGATIWDAHYDPNTPNANSDEFNGSSMPGGTYAPVNLGTSTYTVNGSGANGKPSALVINSQNATGWRGWARSLPSGDFTITACITVNSIATNYCLGGIMLSTTANNTSGTSYNVYVGWNSRPTCIAETGSNWGSAGVAVVHNWAEVPWPQRMIVRLRRVGTTIYTGWGTDGRTFSEASRTDATAYTFFGPSFYMANQGTVNDIAFDYLRYQPAGTGIYYGAFV